MNSYSNVVETSQRGVVSEPLSLQYVPHRDTYFSSMRYALLARPPFANLLHFDRSSLSERVGESLRFAQELGHSTPLVIGSIPFDSSRQPYLRLSTNNTLVEKSDPAITKSIGVNEPPKSVAPKSKVKAFANPDKASFLNSIECALDLFRKTELQKVVLSRTLEINASQALPIASLVSELEQSNPLGYVFAVDLKSEEAVADPIPSPVLVGASPELLVSVRGNKIVANPLAGSEPRNSCEIENRRLSAQLLDSEKDRREHQIVVDDVVRALRPFCKNMKVPSQPSILETPTMLHLSTQIEGTLIDKKTSSIDVAMAMHPTPAVCGYPVQAARNAIDELESFDRDAFTGIVGWCDAQGDGDWVVTIRCAQIQGSKAILYAGAGVVAGSCAEKEWRETGAKFNTMLNALGVQPA